MPRMGEIPDCSIADCAMRVAESRSLDALGAACRRAIGAFTGSPAYGLYWLGGGAPALFASGGIPAGFDEDYRTGLAKCDPFIDSILTRGRVVDGLSLLGARHWPRSIACDLLRTWGLTHDMCGPLRLEDRVVGVFYTGTREGPYTAAHRERMDVLCRASSLALANLAKAGVVDEKSGPRQGHAHSPAPAAFDHLPPRAGEVARWLRRGHSNKEIARRMGISDETVKDHVASLCRRFGALNRTDLAARLESSAALP